MQKRKKGFTIVELVIVIAVIAILAAVLIPTFANVLEKANESIVVQNVRNMNTVLASSSEELEKNYNVVIDREKGSSSDESFALKLKTVANEYRAEAAYLTIKEQGYDIAVINIKSENQFIVYYVPDECFCILSCVDGDFFFEPPYSGASTKDCVLFLNEDLVNDWYSNYYSFEGELYIVTG